jgi:uncharacterized RDD family membrane protein YckC
LVKNWPYLNNLVYSIKNTLQKPGKEPSSKPGFLRRLIIIFYDLLLLIALLMVATALLLPLNAGRAFTAQQFFFPLYLLLVSFFFYAWFWTHGGQTLGLRAWKTQVLTLDMKPIGWKQASLRFIAAMLSWGFCGLGFLWILIDKNQLSWHDRLSKTALFLVAHDK